MSFFRFSPHFRGGFPGAPVMMNHLPSIFNFPFSVVHWDQGEEKWSASQKSEDYGIPLSIRHARFIATLCFCGSRWAVSLAGIMKRASSSPFVFSVEICLKLAFPVRWSMPQKHTGPETQPVHSCSYVWDTRDPRRGTWRNDTVGQCTKLNKMKCEKNLINLI